MCTGWRTDPHSVRMMLMKRSVPQPAIMKTPTGGTARLLADPALCGVRRDSVYVVDGSGYESRDGWWSKR